MQPLSSPFYVLTITLPGSPASYMFPLISYHALVYARTTSSAHLLRSYYDHSDRNTRLSRIYHVLILINITPRAPRSHSFCTFLLSTRKIMPPTDSKRGCGRKSKCSLYIEVKRQATIRNRHNQIPHPALKTKREITKYIN